MNRIFKTIWNKTLGCMAVASELAKSGHATACSKTTVISVTSSTASIFKLSVLVVALSGAMGSGVAWADTCTLNGGVNGGSVANTGFSIACGHSNNVLGAFGSAIGVNNNAAGELSNVIGFGNKTENRASNAIGTNNKALGASSNAIGTGNEASDESSSAIGTENQAKGAFSNAVGRGNIVETNRGNAVGRYNTVTGADNDITLLINGSLVRVGSQAFGEQNTVVFKKLCQIFKLSFRERI